MNVIDRDKYGIYMTLVYLVSKLLNIFIVNITTNYILIFLLIILCLLISLKIDKIFIGERMIYLGLTFLLFSLDLPIMLSMIVGVIGVVLLSIGGIYRYRRLGSTNQFYNWSK